MNPALQAATALLTLGLAELLSRDVLRRRTGWLVRSVLDTADEVVIVELPSRPLLPSLIGGRVPRIHVRCAIAALPSLVLRDVTMVLLEVRLDRRLNPTAGFGHLHGSIPAAEIARQAGVPGRLTLEPGAATVRWMGVPLRFRPELRGDRIKLSPTPFTMTLPMLPPGTTVTGVTAGDGCMHIDADIELATLFSRP